MVSHLVRISSKKEMFKFMFTTNTLNVIHSMQGIFILHLHLNVEVWVKRLHIYNQFCNISI